MKPGLLTMTLLIAGGGIFFSSCNNGENMAGSDDAPIAVRLGKGDIAATRTTNGGNQWSANDEIGLFMVNNGQSLSAASIAEGADNRRYRAQTGGTATSAFIPYDAGQTVYYPQNGNSVDFVAYYPYKATGTAAGQIANYVYPLDVSVQSNPAAIDVLYVRTSQTTPGGYSKTSGTVGLQFRHALSKLSFTLSAGSGLTAADLAGATLTIDNLGVSGSLDLAVGTTTVAATAGSLTANSDNTAIVIPQTLTSATRLIVTLSNSVRYEWNFDAITLTAGNNYLYTVTVSNTAMTVESSGITDWTGINDPATTGNAEEFQLEANSYMVAPGGDATLIPISQANRVLDPSQNQSATTTGLGSVTVGNFTVELVWGDTPVRAGGVIEEMRPEGKYIYVKPGIAGNAVIALRDTQTNTIKWSWHIWVTNTVTSATDPVTGLTWMDRNLGAGVAGSYQVDGRNGLYYQWGRKDAFPGSNGTSGVTGNQDFYTQAGGNTPVTAIPTGSYTTLPDMVHNPLTFAANDNFPGSAGNNSWGGVSGVKTIYDPCPPGWKVPNNRSNWGSTSDWTLGGNGRIYNGMNGTAALNHFYPFTGYRNGTGPQNISTSAYYWTAASGTLTASTPIMLINTNTTSFNTSTSRYAGTAIRCVAE